MYILSCAIMFLYPIFASSVLTSGTEICFYIDITVIAVLYQPRRLRRQHLGWNRECSVVATDFTWHTKSSTSSIAPI